MNQAERPPERACVFGKFDNLVGIYSEPKSPQAGFSDVAVIMLTPGMLHSAGPYRMHVDIARSLRRSGIASFRFDLSGIGESIGVGATGCSLERAASEVRQAIDFLSKKFGIHRVVLFGLCSGADDAMFAAQQDERIIGLFAMDGCGYRTPAFYFERFRSHYLPKIRNASKWKSFLKRGSRKQTQPPTLQLGTDVREFPSRKVAEQQLKQLAQRGVQMHFHYTGGVGDYYNHAKQFKSMFPALRSEPTITTSFASDSDHVAFLCEHRADVVQRVTHTVNQWTANWEPAAKIESPLAKRAKAAHPAESEFESEQEVAPPASNDATTSASEDATDRKIPIFVPSVMPGIAPVDTCHDIR